MALLYIKNIWIGKTHRYNICKVIVATSEFESAADTKPIFECFSSFNISEKYLRGGILGNSKRWVNRKISFPKLLILNRWWWKFILYLYNELFIWHDEIWYLSLMKSFDCWFVGSGYCFRNEEVGRFRASYIKISK